MDTGKQISANYANKREDRTRVPPENQGGEERRRLQRGLQQACNLPATSLQPRRRSGVIPVVLRLGPVPCEPPGDAKNGQLCWTLLNPFARIPSRHLHCSSNG